MNVLSLSRLSFVSPAIETDPLPADLTQFAGAITWADRGCEWIERLLNAPVKVVNCCFDWQGTPGLVSLGPSSSVEL